MGIPPPFIHLIFHIENVQMLLDSLLSPLNYKEVAKTLQTPSLHQSLLFTTQTSSMNNKNTRRLVWKCNKIRRRLLIFISE